MAKKQNIQNQKPLSSAEMHKIIVQQATRITELEAMLARSQEKADELALHYLEARNTIHKLRGQSSEIVLPTIPGFARKQ